MGGAFDIMIWYLSAIYLLSGFLPAFVVVSFLSKMFKRIKFIQLYANHYSFTYSLSALLLLCFQLYTIYDSKHYFTSLTNEIPKNIFYVLVFLLSILPLVFLFTKRSKWQKKSIILLSLGLLFVLFIEQLYPFMPLDKYVFWELMTVIGKSAIWFMGLGFLLTVSVLFRKRMEKR